MNRIYQGRVSKLEIPTSLALSPSAIAPKVYWIRHEEVILDFDLAALYGVEARALNQAVKRNLDRFPNDFMFRLTPAEADEVRHQASQSVTPVPGDSPNSSQTVMSSRKHRGYAYLPYAFRLKIPVWHPADKPSTLNIQRSTNK